MLTIGNSASPEVGSKYCDAQVAAGAEDYYLGRDESSGQWRGSGASALDLAHGARVERKQFMALMRGERVGCAQRQGRRWLRC
jgi:hypothetical protein